MNTPIVRKPYIWLFCGQITLHKSRTLLTMLRAAKLRGWTVTRLFPTLSSAKPKYISTFKAAIKPPHVSHKLFAKTFNVSTLQGHCKSCSRALFSQNASQQGKRLNPSNWTASVALAVTAQFFGIVFFDWYDACVRLLLFQRQLDPKWLSQDASLGGFPGNDLPLTPLLLSCIPTFRLMVTKVPTSIQRCLFMLLALLVYLRKAGYVGNVQILHDRLSDHLIVFWDHTTLINNRNLPTVQHFADERYSAFKMNGQMKSLLSRARRKRQNFLPQEFTCSFVPDSQPLVVNWTSSWNFSRNPKQKQRDNSKINVDPKPITFEKLPAKKRVEELKHYSKPNQQQLQASQEHTSSNTARRSQHEPATLWLNDNDSLQSLKQRLRKKSLPVHGRLQDLATRLYSEEGLMEVDQVVELGSKVQLRGLDSSESLPNNLGFPNDWTQMRLNGFIGVVTRAATNNQAVDIFDSNGNNIYDSFAISINFRDVQGEVRNITLVLHRKNLKAID